MKISTIKELQEYFLGVKGRAELRAQNVEEIIYPLLSMVVAWKDIETDIEVRGTQNIAGNLLWAIINGKRYAFRFDHATVSIEIRENTYKGPIKHTITNKFTLKRLHKIFNSL